MRSFLIFLSALWISCVPTRVPEEGRTVHETFHADVGFSTDERAAIVRATEEWRTFSNSRVEYTVEFDLDFGSATTISRLRNENMIVRVESWMSTVQSMDGGKKRVLGWCKQKRPQRIFLVADRIPNMVWVTAHEMGHAAGLLRLNCGAAEDCDHTEQRFNVMSAVYEGAHAFTAADLEMCQAAGLCD